MNYTEWKQEYLERLIQLIKQHEYSKNYTQDYIDELVIELLERSGFDANFGHWEVTPPEQAVKESFELWRTDYFEEETMISNEIKERLLQRGWYIKCKTEQEADLLLQACNESGITWCTGCKATERKSYKRYPVEIGFYKEDEGLTHGTAEHKNCGCENITDWFFNAIKNNDSKLIPQNAEQEHLVQILLAKMQRIPVECDFGDGDGWVDSTILYIDLGRKYRIKPTTPLPISRELWSYIDKQWKYVAMDKNKKIFFYEKRPIISEFDWRDSLSVARSPFNINTNGINWETSLTERPEDV